MPRRIVVISQFIFLAILALCICAIKTHAAPPFSAWADNGQNTDLSQCHGDKWYFSTLSGASDNNSCDSASQKCSTFTKMRTKWGPGDCMLFERGSVWTNSDPKFTIMPSGTSGNYTIFGSFGSGAMPIIQWDFCCTYQGKLDPNWDNRDWFIVEHIRFRNGADHFIFRWNWIEKNDWNGIKVDRANSDDSGTVSGAEPHDFEISDNLIQDSGEVPDCP